MLSRVVFSLLLWKSAKHLPISRWRKNNVKKIINHTLKRCARTFFFHKWLLRYLIFENYFYFEN